MSLEEPEKELGFFENESLEFNVEVGKMEIKVERKCGEIFIDENNYLFSFLCTLCKAPFEEVSKFFLHIKENHTYEDEYMMDMEVKEEGEYKGDKGDEYKGDKDDEYEEDKGDEYKGDKDDEYEEYKGDEYEDDKENEYEEDKVDEYEENKDEEYEEDKDEEYVQDKDEEYVQDKEDKENEYEEYKVDEYKRDREDEHDKQDEHTLEELMPWSRNKDDSEIVKSIIERIAIDNTNVIPVIFKFTEDNSSDESIFININEGKKNPRKKLKKENEQVNTNSTLTVLSFDEETNNMKHKSEENEQNEHDNMKDENEEYEQIWNDNLENKNEENEQNKQGPKCTICGKVFSRLASLNRHKKLVKCNEKPLKIKVDKIKVYICDICGVRFKSNRALEEHKYFTKRGHNLGSNPQYQSDKAVKKKLVNLSKASQNEKLKCKYCDRIFVDTTKRADHERIHTGEKPFECKICGRRFHKKSYCQMHERTTHATERLSTCEKCGKTFKNEIAVMAHMKRHGKPNLPCNYCEKLFINKVERRQHERIHTGERPYICKLCDKSFQTSGSLSEHHRIKHLNVRLYSCQYCDRSFYTKQQLTNHSAVHKRDVKPFKCELCNTSFALRRSLSLHKKIHSNERNYICRICGRSFKQYSGLYLHKKNHAKNTQKR